MIAKDPTEVVEDVKLIGEKKAPRKSSPKQDMQLVDVEIKTNSMVPAPIDTSPQAMLYMAVQRGASLDELDRLIALKERIEATEAKKAYTESMAQFKRVAPVIAKDKKAGFDSKKSDSRIQYTYASIGNVVENIVPLLAQYGFSHDWTPSNIKNQMLDVTCKITHEKGHSESFTLSCGFDTSGQKNAIQQMASAVTYLQRYTLLLGLGLATKDQFDDDGKTAGQKVKELDELEEHEQKLLERALKMTRDADVLKLYNDNKEKFADAKELQRHFKQEIIKHRNFIQEANKE
jgi:hypothetical protein